MEYLHIIIQLLLIMGVISTFLKAIQDHIYSCANKYHCEYTIYIITCLDLELCIIIDREFGAPGLVKDVVYGPNARHKWIIQLETENLLNNELI